MTLSTTIATFTFIAHSNHNPVNLTTKLKFNKHDVDLSVIATSLPSDLTITLKGPTYDDAFHNAETYATLIGEGLAGLLRSQISSYIVDKIKAISDTVYTVPKISLDEGGLDLEVKLDTLKFSNVNGNLMVSGDIDFD